jgi:hypothetical protein
MLAGGVTGGRRRPLGWEAVAVDTLAVVWRCRLELALLAVAVGVERLLAAPAGEVVALVMVAWLAGVVVAVGPARRLLWRLLRRAWLLRAWARAMADAGLADGPWRVPRVLGTARVAAGDRLQVRVLRGQSALDLEARREELAACLRVGEVRVQRDRADAALAEVTLVRRDPFEHAAPLPWPAAVAAALSLWGAGAGRRG